MSNTGFKAYTNLEQYYVDSGVATGTTKTNSVSDPDYIAPVLDLTYCPLPSVSPSVTPTISVTPSITPTVTPSVSNSPATTPSNSVTPSISITPSVTPTISITPTISKTPSITPSIPASIPVYYYYSADRYECIGGYCTFVETINIANATPISIDAGKYYFDYNNCYIFTIANQIAQTASLITNISGSGTKNCTSLCNIIC